MIDLTKLRSPIAKGDEPLTTAQFLRRMTRAKDALIPPVKQTEILATDPELAGQIGAAMDAVQQEAEANNLFNHQLVAYRDAVTRLARYRLAEGQAEVTEDVETGVDENGDPIMETVVVQLAIDPLPATVEKDTYDAEGNVTGTEQVPNPDIIADDAERTAAQAVVDATPDEVTTFGQ